MRPGPFRKSLIYSSMALLAINPVAVNAVGLGQITVNSQLGQPLEATVPVTLAPGESMPEDCVAPKRDSSGIGSPGTLRVSGPAASGPGTYNLRVTTTNALHEPMYEISLLIDCPGTPLLLRQYVLMLDLPGMDSAVATTTNGSIDRSGDTLRVPVTATPVPSQPAGRTVTPVTNRHAARSLQPSKNMIPAGQPYRVRKGDTLSTIAARIDGRSPDTTWSVANLIFSTNPRAFIRNNPDLIKLGSLIDIPDLAQLAGLEKGRMAIVPSANPGTATEPETSPAHTGSSGVPQPLPAHETVSAPVAMNRPEAFATEPEHEQPVATSPDNAQDTGRDDVGPDDNVAPDGVMSPFAAQAPAVVPPDSGDAAVFTPFLDEQPAARKNPDAPATPPEAAATPAPVVTTIVREAPSKPVNPLLAILVGLLLGVFVSFVTLRRQLIDALTGLLRRRSQTNSDDGRAFSSAPPVDSDAAVATGEFDTSVAGSAFDTRQEDCEPLPIAGPAESTYIVEASEAEDTAQVQIPDFDPAMVENIGEPDANPDDEMLARIFDDNDSTFGEHDADIFDPTGGIDTGATGTFTGPTVEMPRGDDVQSFDPTAEQPAVFDSETFDPTAEFPSGDETVDPSLMNALDESLGQIDADEMFATANHLVDDFLDGSPTSSIPGEPTLGSELDALPSGDEDGLSETLQEALSLLERDFEDEFTASQILERSEISRSLDEKDVDDTQDDDDTATLTGNMKG